MELNPVIRLHWCSFESEGSCVVFEEASGQTYLLDPLRALMLTLFDSGMDHEEVNAEVFQQVQGLGLAGERGVLDDIFQEFMALGLVEESTL